jgi:hypothetical protein
MRKRLALAALAAAIACLAALTAAPGSLADYGATAQYQIEFSANNVGGVPGDGLWLWIELGRDGSGDFTGSICVHTGSAGLDSAFAQAGDVSWSDDGTNLTISHLVLELRTGAQVPVTITVPDAVGHYSGPTAAYLSPTAFIGGDAQVEVAP